MSRLQRPRLTTLRAPAHQVAHQAEDRRLPLHAPAPPLEQIPEEALEILKDGIETDMPLRCAQALQFHLKDITACPYAICDIRRYGDKGEVIGTEWRTLRGRYKWSIAAASGSKSGLPS